MKLTDVLLIVIGLFIIGHIVFDWFGNNQVNREFQNLQIKIEELSKQKTQVDSVRKITKAELLENKRLVDSLLGELETSDLDTISFNDAIDLLNQIGGGK
jgi:ribosomal protein L7/L12